MFSKLKKDKLVLSLLFIVLVLGIFLRVDNTEQVGYFIDDEATIPAGLMWFYPHSYFPGLNYGNPPLGDMIIGFSCTLSGEDFSGVSNIRPFFYPDRYGLLGEAMANSDFECHLPMYIFGIIFFLLITIFAFMFFNNYTALFITSFFAFSSTALKYSRWIKPDVILWTWVIGSLILFVKSLEAEKFSKKEKWFLLSSLALAGMSLATKFSAGFIIVVYFILFAHKYRKELFDKSKIKNIIVLGLQGLAAYVVFLLAFFKFNPKNFFETYNIYQNFNQGLAGTSFSFSNLFLYLRLFISEINIIDVVLFFFGIYLYIKLIKKENKKAVEKLILVLAPTAFILVLLFPVFLGVYRSFPYLLGVVFLMGLFFSKVNPLSKLSYKKYLFLIILIIYIPFSFYNAYSISPHFENRNVLSCALSPENCVRESTGAPFKQTAEYLVSVLEENETFIGMEGTIFFYLRHNQAMLDWQFHEAVRRQVGREPTLSEKVEFFKPEARNVRYYLASPYSEENLDGADELKVKYKPSHTIQIKGVDAVWIYDLENLEERT